MHRDLSPIDKEDQFLEETCQICYMQYQKYKHEPLRPALICYECWYQHVKTNLTKISYTVGADIISPFESSSNIEVVLALNGLRQFHRHELEQWLFRKYTAFTPDIQKCPSETCDFVYTAQQCSWGIKQLQKCPKCLGILGTGSSFSIGSILGFIYFLFLTKKCPKCSIPIEKTSGCPHMTCPCGHEFCWFCLKDHMPKSDNLYSVHEPKECAFIFISKLLIVLTCTTSLSFFLVGGQTIRQLVEGLFSLLGYTLQAILIDLYIVGIVLGIKIYRSQPYRNLPFQNCNRSVQLFVLIASQVIIVPLLYVIEVLSSTIQVLFFELKLTGLVGGLVFLVIHYNRNWFQYVA